VIAIPDPDDLSELRAGFLVIVKTTFAFF
jgi:hypothetical protein